MLFTKAYIKHCTNKILMCVLPLTLMAALFVGTVAYAQTRDGEMAVSNSEIAMNNEWCDERFQAILDSEVTSEEAEMRFAYIELEKVYNLANDCLEWAKDEVEDESILEELSEVVSDAGKILAIGVIIDDVQTYLDYTESIVTLCGEVKESHKDWEEAKAAEEAAAAKAAAEEEAKAKAASTSSSSSGSYSHWFKSKGVVYSNGVRYTWYSQRTLPGGGLTALNNNGRTVNSDGFVTDGDGYLACASSDYSIGTILETPFGTAKVYDSGCASGTVDMYTDW